MQLSTQTRTCMLDNSPIQATFHAPSRTFDQIMSSVCCCYCRFCFCLIRYFPFFSLLFHQRSLSTSLLNSTECFCVPWSWTDHLPRRKASPVASPSVYRMSLLFAPLRSIRKLFLFTATCVTVAALMQYFLMAAFCWMLIEGIYLYFFVVKVYNINTKMYMYHVISWG